MLAQCANRLRGAAAPVDAPAATTCSPAPCGCPPLSPLQALPGVPVGQRAQGGRRGHAGPGGPQAVCVAGQGRVRRVWPQARGTGRVALLPRPHLRAVHRAGGGRVSWFGGWGVGGACACDAPGGPHPPATHVRVRVFTREPFPPCPPPRWSPRTRTTSGPSTAPASSSPGPLGPQYIRTWSDAACPSRRRTGCRLCTRTSST